MLNGLKLCSCLCLERLLMQVNWRNEMSSRQTLIMDKKRLLEKGFRVLQPLQWARGLGFGDFTDSGCPTQSEMSASN